MAQYVQVRRETVERQSAAGLDLLARRADAERQRFLEAEAALREFLASRPTPPVGQPRPTSDEAEMVTLQARYEAQRDRHDGAAAELREAQAVAAAGVASQARGLDIVDPPAVRGQTGSPLATATRAMLLALVLGGGGERRVARVVHRHARHRAHGRRSGGPGAGARVAHVPFVAPSVGQPNDIVRSAFARRAIGPPADR